MTEQQPENFSLEEDNVTVVLEDFEEFDLRDALNVAAYSLMSSGEEMQRSIVIYHN